MSEIFWNEEWKELKMEGIAATEVYQISSHGRVKSFKNNTDGNILKGSTIGGYKTITLRRENGKRVAKYVHRLVAQLYLEQHSDEHRFVIHKDFRKENNHVDNLQWVTKKEKEAHQNVNPNFVRTKKMVKYSKLTESKVSYLKKRINDPNRKTRLKMLAKQFGISEMQLYRIKRGENWGHVKPEE